MKHLFIAFTAFLLSATSYAQLEISVSTGYAVSSAGMKLGETVSDSGTENFYGSYGEGANVQIRGTYFFNESFGVDLGFGYLHGADQTVTPPVGQLPDNTTVDAIARARAFGASTSIVYKFNNNIYGRFGALLKLGGKTEGVVSSQTVLTENQANAFNVPQGSFIQNDYVEDFHGHFPLGFVGALGYKFNINDNLNLFIEAEYYGISLKRKDSEITEFNGDLVLPNGTVAVSGLYSIDNLAPGFNKVTTYVDNLAHDDPDSSKKLSQKVPYSSFGINFGITYKFKSSNKYGDE
ncbi:outer membrane beta-barrel protein [Olleya sp. Bg11-27]|uniref:outer membrane beta-barrel protein n=1 Tax=Olleya sp. Bg11-27 TaxID=2058135 RepID=UPI000C3073B8|nr:outer membrane beta-barrel protein [Olleya sp. Bg11-27]AUC76494.1 hypothetical protein CW732_12775 [Olleya sp. Bg11-27]